MKEVVSKIDFQEIDHKLSTDPKFAEYIDKKAAEIRPMVEAKIDAVAREIALYGVVGLALITEMDWQSVPQIVDQRVALVNPTHLAFLGKTEEWATR